MINLSSHSTKDLASQLGEHLLNKNTSVATAESCTGGGVAYAITEIAGSSQWFTQSWVTYSNEAKHNLLGVESSTINSFGAVSQEVVIEMASKGANLSQAGLCLAVSGIAGPGGGSAEKPVGLVWFAIANTLKSETFSFSRRFSGNRQQVREQAINLSLEKLIESLAD